MKIMKIMKRLMGCAAAILALTACSESEDLLAAYHSDSKAVHITAQVGKASADGFTRSNPLGATEADQAKFNENDEISVQADGQDAVTYQFNGSEWVPQGGKFLKWEKETMNFTAYYPAKFNGTINQPTEYTSPESLAAADFMSFSGPQSNINKSNQLTLTMERKMARVVVEIAAFNDQYTKNATVKSVTINGNIKAYKHSDNKFYALINPNSTSSTTAPFLTLEVEDGTSTTTETLTNTPTFEAGKSYTYKLKVGKNKISVFGISVANWNTGTITEGSKAELVPLVTFTADGEQKFKMNDRSYTISGLEYSVNDGEWATVEAGIEVTFGGPHGDLRLRGTNTNGTATTDDKYSTITFTDKNVKVACTGDIRTLQDWRNYSTVNTQNAKFCYLFKDCAVLTSAPDLPATTLAENCYFGMFRGCTSLTSAPELPATNLAYECYSRMFSGCTSLEKAPELKTTTLAHNCYSFMFSGCTSLEKAPELKATKLVASCYKSMFSGCTSLEKAPELKATKLASQCYESMFNGCTKLSSVTMLAPSNQISRATDCCYNWLYDAGTSTTSRKLIVLDEAAYNALVSKTKYLPDNWKIGATGTTVVDENNAEINIE